jgi:hypothetical protein
MRKSVNLKFGWDVLHGAYGPTPPVELFHESVIYDNSDLCHYAIDLHPNDWPDEAIKIAHDKKAKYTEVFAWPNLRWVIICSDNEIDMDDVVKEYRNVYREC